MATKDGQFRQILGAKCRPIAYLEWSNKPRKGEPGLFPVYIPNFLRLSSLQSIWQLSSIVLPPSC